MLAPALSFALQGLWTEEQDSRARFWRAVSISLATRHPIQSRVVSPRDQPASFPQRRRK